LGRWKKYRQLSARHAGPFIREVFARFRRDLIDASQAADDLGVSRSRFYVLHSVYLRACAATACAWTARPSATLAGATIATVSPLLLLCLETLT
jgi:hypothetical protein